MSAQRKALLYSSVQNCTEKGHEFLRNGQLLEASQSFMSAFVKSEEYGNEYLTRACSFNLGACYVASGNPGHGIDYLEQAIPPSKGSDGLDNYGDLYYNIGVARHALGEMENAAEAYQKAATAYEELKNVELQVETLTKLVQCYQSLDSLSDAGETLDKVQQIYESLGQKENQATALSTWISLLAQMGELEKCGKVLSTLLDICQDFEDAKLQAKIYHDIGLVYSAEKCHQSASECFEHAYHSLQGLSDKEQDKSLLAIVLQNLGAIYNQMEVYERAGSFHKMAADLYGELGDRKAQSQVFCNMAFAHSQTKNYEEAINAFSHSIQACKDCGDKEGHWLSTEGLAAVYFRMKNYNKAINYYKEAITLAAIAGEQNTDNSQRLVDKLSEAMEFQITAEQRGERGVQKFITSKKVGSVKKSSTPRKSGSYRRRGNPRFETHRSLVAKGLDGRNSDDEEEEGSSVEDSSEYSESYDNDSIEESEDEQQVLNPDRNDRNLAPSKIVHEVNPYMSSTILSNGSGYEKPVVPVGANGRNGTMRPAERDRVAQDNAFKITSEQTDESPSQEKRRQSSRTCIIQ